MKNYWMIVHPKTLYRLKVMLAREKYKHDSWIPRWERWSGRKYIEIDGEAGKFYGFLLS